MCVIKYKYHQSCNLGCLDFRSVLVLAFMHYTITFSLYRKYSSDFQSKSIYWFLHYENISLIYFKEYVRTQNHQINGKLIKQIFAEPKKYAAFLKLFRNFSIIIFF